MRKIILPIAIVATSIFNTSCSSEDKTTIKQNAAIPVVVGTVSNNNHNGFVTASGKVEAENSALLSTRMMGYVTKMNVKVGDKVHAGQLLVSISNTDLQAKKAQVEASILQATAANTNAKKDYERFMNLYQQQSASQKELDDITARYEMTKAGLEAAKQLRNEVLAQFSYANITAPFAGVVTNTFIKQGDMANPGMPLLSIEGASKLQVVAMVSESDISKIQTGTSVKVMVKSLDKTFAGKVIELSNSASNTGGQYMVKIALEEAQSVLSGMYVNVQFPVATSENIANESSKILIPESVLIHQGQLIGVYTVAANKTALLRWLRIGKAYGDQVEVLSGLSAQEQFILSADGKLYNGAKVAF